MALFETQRQLANNGHRGTALFNKKVTQYKGATDHLQLNKTTLDNLIK